MLVIQRKRNEVVYIGDDITITIIAADFGRVRLGIDAPSSVKIYRSEVKARIDAIRDGERRNKEHVE